MSEQDNTAKTGTSEFNTTRCPHCREMFRITAEQIAAAESLVRCGRCRRLFQAEPVKSRRSKHHPGTALTPAREALLANIDKGVLLTERTQKLAPGSLADSAWLQTAYNPLEYLEPPASLFSARALLATLALVLVLALQAAWFNRAQLWDSADVGPLLASTCAILSCTEPPVTRLVPVETRSLTIRSHPLTPDVLRASIVMRNTSHLAQEFPVLWLSFIATDGDVVAQRFFLPEEYLAGELTGETHIPPDYDIQIALNLVDPGERVDRYHLQLIDPG